MKKTVKNICDILECNRSFLNEFTEKTLMEYGEKPYKLIILSCPYPLRFIGELKNVVYPITSYGGTLWGNEVTLDYAVKSLEIPVLMILGHEYCSAIKAALKGDAKTKSESEFFAAITPAFQEGRARKFRDNIMKHIDYQVATALERYRTLVKMEKLSIVGVFCDSTGVFHLTNYNGLRGEENLVQALPDVDPSSFLG